MRLASFLLFLALPQAQATDVTHDNYLVVERSCTKESKTCKDLLKKEDLPKGKECAKIPTDGVGWVSTEIGSDGETFRKGDIRLETFLSKKEAAALAERANKGELKGLCTLAIPTINSKS